MASGTVVLQLLTLTRARLLELGCDEAALDERVPLPKGPPFRRAPFELLCELVEAGLEQTGDPHLGLSLSLDFDPREGGVLFLLMFACPDLRAAIKRFHRYQRLLFDAYRLEVEDRERRIVMVLPGPERPAMAQLREWALMDAVRAADMLTGLRVEPVAMTFSHPRPPQVERLELAYRCSPVFDAPRTSLTLHEETVRAPLRHANEMFRAALEHETRSLASAIPVRRSWTERVEGVLRDELSRQPSLASVATRLRVSPRTLQRRLAREGTSVAELLTTLRRELAARYLREGRDIAEVAYLTGYTTPESFHRAFRAWYGTTPAAFRDSEP